MRRFRFMVLMLLAISLLTTDFTETDSQIPRSGRIGLQIHSGKPAEVWYRDLMLGKA